MRRNPDPWWVVAVQLACATIIIGAFLYAAMLLLQRVGEDKREAEIQMMQEAIRREHR